MGPRLPTGQDFRHRTESRTLHDQRTRKLPSLSLQLANGLIWFVGTCNYHGKRRRHLSLRNRYHRRPASLLWAIVELFMSVTRALPSGPTISITVQIIGFL